MIAVALMSDPGNSFIKGKGKDELLPSWGKPRLGQCVVILELIAHVQKLISEKKDPTAVSFLALHKALSGSDPRVQPYENSKEPVVRFMGALEARLAIMMDARVSPLAQSETILAIECYVQEASSLLPVSHRILLAWLLSEMRLFTRSLKS